MQLLNIDIILELSFLKMVTLQFKIGQFKFRQFKILKNYLKDYFSKSNKNFEKI